MKQVLTTSEARANIYQLVDQVASSHQPVTITGKRNNAVIISESDWNAISETLYLNSIPGMTNSIKSGMNANDTEFSDTVDW